MQERVSILVFMEVALDLHEGASVEGLLDVSILVFMEVALDQRVFMTMPCVYMGFNPCFHGSSSRSWFSICR